MANLYSMCPRYLDAARQSFRRRHTGASGRDPPPQRFVDIAEGGRKTDVLSTFCNVKYDKTCGVFSPRSVELGVVFAFEKVL